MIAAGAVHELALARQALGAAGQLDERGELEQVGLGDRLDEQRLLAGDGETDVGPLELTHPRPLAHPQPVQRGVLAQRVRPSPAAASACR